MGKRTYVPYGNKIEIGTWTGGSSNTRLACTSIGKWNNGGVFLLDPLSSGKIYFCNVNSNPKHTQIYPHQICGLCPWLHSIWGETRFLWVLPSYLGLRGTTQENRSSGWIKIWMDWRIPTYPGLKIWIRAWSTEGLWNTIFCWIFSSF